MVLWKWLISLTFLAVVLSDDVAEIPSSLKITHDDLLRMLPNQQEKMKDLVEKLSKANNERQQVAILNDYTDDLLQHLNNFIVTNAVDPIPMPDIEESFEWKVLFVTYYGEMSLKDGWLQGLSTFTRKGDVTLRYGYPNVKIHIPLGFNTLLFDYNYKAKFMGLGPTGNVDGKVVGCSWTMDLDLNMVTLRATLDKYELNTLGKVSLKFHGNGLADFFVNVFVKVTIPLVKPAIKFVVEVFINGGMKLVLDFYNQAICTLLADCPPEILF